MLKTNIQVETLCKDSQPSLKFQRKKKSLNSLLTQLTTSHCQGVGLWREKNNRSFCRFRKAWKTTERVCSGEDMVSHPLKPLSASCWSIRHYPACFASCNITDYLKKNIPNKLTKWTTEKNNEGFGLFGFLLSFGFLGGFLGFCLGFFGGLWFGSLSWGVF